MREDESDGDSDGGDDGGSDDEESAKGDTGGKGEE